MTTTLLPDRVEIGVKPTTPCREYRGPRTSAGYGDPILDGAQVYLHRWIVERFEGRPLEPGELVMHRCDNPPCFRYDHLVRATNSVNLADAYAKGRRAVVRVVGARNGNAKLNARAVRTIRRRYRPGHGGTVAALAERFAVHPSVIHSVAKGQAWQHVK